MFQLVQMPMLRPLIGSSQTLIACLGAVLRVKIAFACGLCDVLIGHVELDSLLENCDVLSC